MEEDVEEEAYGGGGVSSEGERAVASGSRKFATEKGGKEESASARSGKVARLEGSFSRQEATSAMKGREKGESGPEMDATGVSSSLTMSLRASQTVSNGVLSGSGVEPYGASGYGYLPKTISARESPRLQISALIE